jgi:superfamily II DNA helicase RecQ
MDQDTIPDHINPQYTHVPLPVLKMCQELSEISMVDAFGKRPFPWQKAIITHLNLMTCPTSGIPASPTFLCAPTGGGKSIARDSFAAGQGNVSWCISPLLSLGADQVIKINANSANGDGAVVAFHLDHYRQPAQQRSICQRISQITGVSNTTVCITSSPQALVNNKLYYGLYRDLLRNDLLKLLTVDELQLFVQFGRRFRNEFFALKDKVFAPISLSGGKRSKIPILFMTATATKTILEQTTLLTGLTFCKRNIFWPGPSHMLQRRCQIEFIMTSQPFSILTSIVDKLYKAM